MRLFLFALALIFSDDIHRGSGGASFVAADTPLAPMTSSLKLYIEGPLPLSTQLIQLEELRKRGTLDDDAFRHAVHETSVSGPLVNAFVVLGALHSKGQLTLDEFVVLKEVVLSQHVDMVPSRNSAALPTAGAAKLWEMSNRDVDAQAEKVEAARRAKIEAEAAKLKAEKEEEERTQSAIAHEAAQLKAAKEEEGRTQSAIAHQAEKLKAEKAEEERIQAEDKAARLKAAKAEEKRIQEEGEEAKLKAEKEEKEKKRAQAESEAAKMKTEKEEEERVKEEAEAAKLKAGNEKEEPAHKEDVAILNTQHEEKTKEDGDATLRDDSNVGEDEDTGAEVLLQRARAKAHQNKLARLASAHSGNGQQRDVQQKEERKGGISDDSLEKEDKARGENVPPSLSGEVGSATTAGETALSGEVSGDETFGSAPDDNLAVSETDDASAALTSPEESAASEADDVSATSKSSEELVASETDDVSTGSELSEESAASESDDGSESSEESAASESDHVSTPSESLEESVASESDDVATASESSEESAASESSEDSVASEADDDSAASTSPEVDEVLAASGSEASETGITSLCVGWKQTGGCTPDGPRESGSDKTCNEEVPAGASGYCECEGGGRAAKSDCEHGPFSCEDKCREENGGEVEACVGWKQTGGCTPDGPRESGSDKACNEEVPAGASGYCECARGKRVAESDCEHGAFQCAQKCAEALL